MQADKRGGEHNVFPTLFYETMPDIAALKETLIVVDIVAKALQSAAVCSLEM